jgi:hypothetical protein
MERGIGVITSISVSNAGAAAGVTNVNGNHVDMQGFDGVLFIAVLGALTATQVTSLKAQSGKLSNDSDQADLAGTNTGPAADTDSNKTLVLDVYRPQDRYVRPVLVRGTANAVLQALLAIPYSAMSKPVVKDASVSALKVTASPAYGTP